MPATLRIPSPPLLLTIFCLASTLALAGCSQPQNQAQSPEQAQSPAADAARVASTPLPTDPDTVVAAMTAYLKTLGAFSIDADIAYDEALPTGPKIQYLATASISVRRPDRLRAEVSDDDGDRTIYYDGKSLSVFGRTHNAYATVDAPSTLDSLFAKALNEYDLGLPLVDILYQSVHGTLLEGVKTSVVVGRSRVDGVECDHLAFHQDDVDWQLWVEASATPLPRRMVITTLGGSGQPQYEAGLIWNLSPKIEESMFAFTPPRDAARIKLATLAAAAQAEGTTNNSK